MSKPIFFSIITFGDVNHIIENLMLHYDPKNFYLIHYNKLSKKRDFKKLLNFANKYENIKVFSKFKVRWARFSILETQLYCMKEFLKQDKFNIFCCLDNFTLPINISKIKNMTDKDLFLNLNRDYHCVFDKSNIEEYKKRIKNETSNQHLKKYIWLLDRNYYKSRIISLIFYVIDIFLISVFYIYDKAYQKIHHLPNKKSRSVKPFYPKIENFDEIKLKNPYTISSSLAFTRNQINQMFSDKLFWKIIDFSKDKCAPEEWAIHNYWDHIIKDKKNYKTHISIKYILINTLDLKELGIQDFSDIVFLRFRRNKWNDIYQNIKNNNSINLTNINLKNI